MQRFTIIHHDVRIAFGLTLSEYMVCDSIHQLSHRYPTTKSASTIATFIGVHKDTVNSAKKSLMEKGLIEQLGDGLKTTDRWFDAVTYAKNGGDDLDTKSTKVKGGDGNSVGSTENPSNAQYIIKKDIQTSSPSEEPFSDIEAEVDDIELVIDEELAPATSLRNRPKGPSNPLITWAEGKNKRRFATPLKQRSAILALQRAGYDDEDIKAVWLDLEADPYWKERGVDFTIVLSQIDKLNTRVDVKKMQGVYNERVKHLSHLISADTPREEVKRYVEEFIRPLKERYGFK